MTAWYEGFFDGLYGRVLPKTYDDTQTGEQARMIKRLLKLRKGQCALDVPCGMGRITVPLARAGVAMTGVDLNAGYLRRARRDAKKEGLDIRFVRRDMREIDFDREFDGVFNWFGSFGYFSDADNQALLKRVYRALKPGGRFLLEGGNKSWIRAHWRPEMETTIGGVRILERSEWHEPTQQIHGAWTFQRGSEVEKRRLTVRLYNGAEIRQVLRAAGFRDIELYGRPPLGRFTRHSRRLVAVARRPTGR